MTCLPEFLIILLACFGLAMGRLCNNHDNENFVRAFNRQVPAHLQQETKDDIISLGLLSSYHSVDDYVFLWKFADKYDIVSFPDVDIHNINTILQQLRDADEYVKVNHIPNAEASKIFNEAFASMNMDLTTLLELSGQ